MTITNEDAAAELEQFHADVDAWFAQDIDIRDNPIHFAMWKAGKARGAPSKVQGEAVRAMNLEGLRAKLLAPREITRDDEGWLWHPDYPICDEGTRADKFLEAFGIEAAFVSMESDLPDLHERWCDEGLTDCSEWTPTPPTGDGWMLLEIYDTEDGPYAMFGRDLYAAEQARKKEHTRRLRDEFLRRRADAAAASGGEKV